MVGEGKGVGNLLFEPLVGHCPRFVAAECEETDVPRLAFLFHYHVVEAVEGHVVVHSPGVVLLLRGSEVNVADYCLVASCPEIALHVGEVYVASVEKTACIAVAVEC